jgi:tetratricopeptide (TPR) repeat protein
MSQDDLARLEALGYVSATVEGADFDLDAQRELEDPKDLLPFHLETQEVSRLLATGKLDEATVTLEQLLEQRPGYTWAHRQLGAIALKRADPGAAIVHFERALALDPASPEGYLRLGAALTALDRVAEAIGAYRRGLETRPDSVELMNNLAWKLATCRDPRLRDVEQALRLAEEANRLSGNQQPVVLDTLATAYAAASQFKEAVAAAERARQAAVAAGSGELAEEIAERLELYRRGTPFVDAR